MNFSINYGYFFNDYFLRSKECLQNYISIVTMINIYIKIHNYPNIIFSPYFMYYNNFKNKECPNYNDIFLVINRYGLVTENLCPSHDLSFIPSKFCYEMGNKYPIDIILKTYKSVDIFFIIYELFMGNLFFFEKNNDLYIIVGYDNEIRNFIILHNNHKIFVHDDEIIKSNLIKISIDLEKYKFIENFHLYDHYIKNHFSPIYSQFRLKYDNIVIGNNISSLYSVYEFIKQKKEVLLLIPNENIIDYKIIFELDSMPFITQFICELKIPFSKEYPIIDNNVNEIKRYLKDRNINSENFKKFSHKKEDIYQYIIYHMLIHASDKWYYFQYKNLYDKILNLLSNNYILGIGYELKNENLWIYKRIQDNQYSDFIEFKYDKLYLENTHDEEYSLELYLIVEFEFIKNTKSFIKNIGNIEFIKPNVIKIEFMKNYQPKIPSFILEYIKYDIKFIKNECLDIIDYFEQYHVKNFYIKKKQITFNHIKLEKRPNIHYFDNINCTLNYDEELFMKIRHFF